MFVVSVVLGVVVSAAAQRSFLNLDHTWCHFCGKYCNDKSFLGSGIWHTWTLSYSWNFRRCSSHWEIAKNFCKPVFICYHTIQSGLDLKRQLSQTAETEAEAYTRSDFEVTVIFLRHFFSEIEWRWKFSALKNYISRINGIVSFHVKDNGELRRRCDVVIFLKRASFFFSLLWATSSNHHTNSIPFPCEVEADHKTWNNKCETICITRYNQRGVGSWCCVLQLETKPLLSLSLSASADSVMAGGFINTALIWQFRGKHKQIKVYIHWVLL